MQDYQYIEYRISNKELHHSKDEAAKYGGSTRSGEFVMAASTCTSVTEAPEVLPWQTDYVLLL